jgi:hypothetical protein
VVLAYERKVPKNLRVVVALLISVAVLRFRKLAERERLVVVQIHVNGGPQAKRRS